MSSHFPHRNRLLALEQELQSRRATGDRQRKQQHRQEPPSQASVPPPSKDRPVAPPAPPSSVSPWQVLADRLTQNQPVRYIPSPPPLDLPPPDFAPEPLSASVQRSTLPSQQKFPPTFPSQIRHPTTPPPPSAILPSDLPQDDIPLESWQDLAAQIRQARSPQQLELSLSPTTPIKAESFEIEDFNPASLPELSVQSASELVSIKFSTTDAESDEFPEFVVEDWEFDAVAMGQSSSMISVEPLIHSLNSGGFKNEGDSILARRFVNFAQATATVADSPTTSAIVQSHTPTETEIVPLVPAKPGGALVTQCQADRGILTRYSPNATDSLLAVWRSPQLQRAIPWLTCLIIPAVCSGLFLPSTHGFYSLPTGDTLCVPQKIDSRN